MKLIASVEGVLFYFFWKQCEMWTLAVLLQQKKPHPIIVWFPDSQFFFIFWRVLSIPNDILKFKTKI